jgi:ArsR family transcriptional regulator
LNDQALELVAERFRLLSEPMRLKLLQALQGGEKSVGELVQATGGGQANVSKHLAALSSGGLVERRKEGLNVLYRVADESVFTLCDTVCGSVAAQLEAKRKAMRGLAGRA